MGEGISTGYEALGMSKRSASGIGEKNHTFRASAPPEGAVAPPEGVTRLEFGGGVGGRQLLVFAHFASGHMLLLPLAASATACLKCAALAFLIASPLALSASRWTLQASSHGHLVSYLLALLTFLTCLVRSLNHQETEKETGCNIRMFWATASLINLISLFTPRSKSSQLL